ncbi:hypothetical protein [Parasitella parasitica]|uniref:C2H2-type domain-containing protein n=1 Tax=Parasitella parasitica TaxID=35722 RepID=A0A0B7MYT2_9FUNG|nr:hypothetical protein [Parasitella parasitica]
MSVGDCVSSPFLTAELANSPSQYSKSDSYDQKQELENNFCRDFACCGLQLNNLHQLLEHYEEYHLSRRAGEDDDRDQLQLKSTVSLDPYQTGSIMQNSFTHPPKKHLTIADLNMLENAQRYAPETKIQTLSSIVDGLHTPSLSPSESAVAFESQMLDHELATQKSKSSNNDTVEKPYRCLVEDCDKAYKNANGLKYHRLHGHCPPSENSDALDASKPYICSLGNCKKRYKNLNGLKYHMEHTHMIKIPSLSSDLFVKSELSSTTAFSQQADGPATRLGLKRKLSSSSLSSASSYQSCL